MCFLLLYYQLFHSILHNINENHHKFTIQITTLNSIISELYFFHAYQL